MVVQEDRGLTHPKVWFSATRWGSTAMRWMLIPFASEPARLTKSADPISNASQEPRPIHLISRHTAARSGARSQSIREANPSLLKDSYVHRTRHLGNPPVVRNQVGRHDPTHTGGRLDYIVRAGSWTSYLVPQSAERSGEWVVSRLAPRQSELGLGSCSLLIYSSRRPIRCLTL